jgi:hypothetical protein
VHRSMLCPDSEPVHRFNQHRPAMVRFSHGGAEPPI